MGAYEQSLGLATVNDLAYYDANFLVSQYDMNDASGSPQDSIGTNHLTVSGSPTYSATGINGDAITKPATTYFYLQSANLCPDATEDFFVHFFFQTTTSGTNNLFAYLTATGSTANPNVFFQSNGDNELRVVVQNATVYDSWGYPGIDRTTGGFHSYGIGRKILDDGTAEYSAYLNGLLVSMGYQATPTDLSSNYFILGRSVSSTGAAGEVDECRVYRGVGAMPNQASITELANLYA